MGALLPLTVNAEMSFPDLPFEERVEALHDMGFRVGLWGLGHLDVDRLARLGATCSMCDGFGQGSLVTKEGADALLASVEEMIPRVITLGRPIMNLHGTKLGPSGAALDPVATSPARCGWCRATRSCGSPTWPSATTCASRSRT